MNFQLGIGNRCANRLIALNSALLLMLLIISSTVHAAVNSWESHLTIAANSFIGIHPTFDQSLGWLNTRLGDVVVCSLLVTIFIAHSFGASTFNDLVERLSFWGWVGALCISTYLLTCATEHLYCHPIPVQALPQLHDVRSMYAIPVHASAFNSFPSGHGLAYIFFALMAWFKRYRRMSVFLILFGTVMLGTRVVLGMHWLSDIFLGALPLSVVLRFAAMETPLKRVYPRFYSLTYFLVAKLSGHAWIFERLATSHYKDTYRITAWTDAETITLSNYRALEPLVVARRSRSSQ